MGTSADRGQPEGLAESDLCSLGSALPEWGEISHARTWYELRAELEDLIVAARRPAPFLMHGVNSLTVSNLLVAQVADDSGYSYEQWLREFRFQTGVTPSHLAAYHRLRRATDLAEKNPQATLEDLAARTGFSEATALARSAARQTGRPFRRLVREFKLPD